VLACVAAPALVAAGPAAVAVLVHGYRQATAREDRLALRLVLLVVAGGLGARLLLVDLPRQLSGRPLLPDGLLLLVLVPTLLGCLLVALLRFRLDDIEPGVRRTLVQVLVVALVGTVFATAARAVGLAAETSFASMVAGGVLARLLVPVAVGLQRARRRLVYGDRAAAHRVVAELRRLDPLSDPPAILEETLHLLSRRLHLSAAAIEVTGPGPADHVAVAVGSRRGQATTVDLAVGDTAVGRLELEVHPDRDPFGPADRRLLEDVGQQVGTLVQAVSINRRLQHSRQALVTAREEERRRVRRDLHDGLGPSLATLALRLESARDLIAADPVGASAEVGELAERVRAQIAEVRRLVDGLRPPVLDQLGLLTALRQRAAEHRLATARDETALGWTVVGDEDLGPLPAAVEVAAYWIAVEAVTNAVRHSAGRSCTVTLRREPAALHVVVRDDGTGLPEGVSPGVGLSSMRERAEEVGGTCTLTSTPGRGTVVEAWLPLSAAGSAR
jgi:signal transduction histidine kinase